MNVHTEPYYTARLIAELMRTRPCSPALHPPSSEAVPDASVERWSWQNTVRKPLINLTHVSYFKGKKTGVQKSWGTDSIPAAGRSGTANQPSIAPHRCLFSRGITASDGLKRGRGCNGAAHLVCGDAWKTELGEPWVSIALALAGLGAILILELSWFVG